MSCPMNGISGISRPRIIYTAKPYMHADTMAPAVLLCVDPQIKAESARRCSPDMLQKVCFLFQKHSYFLHEGFIKLAYYVLAGRGKACNIRMILPTHTPLSFSLKQKNPTVTTVHVSFCAIYRLNGGTLSQAKKHCALKVRSAFFCLVKEIHGISLTKRLRFTTRLACALTRSDPTLRSAISVFRHEHVAPEIGFILIRACGHELCEAYIAARCPVRSSRNFFIFICFSAARVCRRRARRLRPCFCRSRRCTAAPCGAGAAPLRSGHRS